MFESLGICELDEPGEHVAHYDPAISAVVRIKPRDNSLATPQTPALNVLIIV